MKSTREKTADLILILATCAVAGSLANAGWQYVSQAGGVNPVVSNSGIDAGNSDVSDADSVTDTQAIEPLPHALIEFYTGDNCRYCEAWKPLIPKLESKGWDVQEIEADGGPVPRFVVWVDGEEYHHTGYMSFDDMGRLLGHERPVSSDDYKPRWTWPGDLRTHLEGAPHNLDTTGMTQDDMERWHDDQHDIGPVTSSRSAQYCPDGNCPPKRLRLFRWRR